MNLNSVARQIFAVALILGCATHSTTAHEWDKYDVPVTAPDGKRWVLHPSSDEFNYRADSIDKGPEFRSRWVDYYHSNWSGPAPTIWQRDHVSVSDGELKIIATRPDNVPMKRVNNGDESEMMRATYTGCISSKELVHYPVYIEARAKLSNSTMASDVWMLSPDATQEIDIIEAYGSDRNGGGYGADRLHLSHHVFIRRPFQDYQPREAATWYKDDEGTIWREEYHRVGVYWRDPTYLEYFVDGKSVRVVEGMQIIDPNGYTNGTGLNKGLNIIINMEDQSWRAVKGLSPTDEELKDRENCTFKVDWIRAYNLVEE